MPWERYEPVEHALITLTGSEQLAQGAREQAGEAAPSTDAVLIGLVAESGKTAAKYEFPETLVWRDAGVVLGYLSLVAEALKLNFCPLGMTGDAYISPLSDSQLLLGAGLALLGARVPPD
jgi:hypothetical protein